MKIGLLSDTHSFLHERVQHHFKDCDEIWHAGDFGSLAVADAIEGWGKPFRAVYGNIDGAELRVRYPEDLWFDCAGVSVYMTHIGGYPGKYAPRVRPLLQMRRPQIFITGHSHILKVMPDPALGLLHINPGACGLEGWHKVKTLIRFEIINAKPTNLEVIELA
jgi:uncharacterized protein